MKQKILIIVIVATGLCIALFSYLNSQLFIKQFILPKIADELQMDISTGNILFSIFNGITISDLEVGNGNELLAKAKSIKVKYFWKAALNREFIIDEILVEDGFIHLIKDENGNLNLPESSGQSASVSNNTSRRTDMPRFVINDINLNNCHFVYDDKTLQSSYSFNNINISTSKLTANKAADANITSTISITPPTDQPPILFDAEIKLSAYLNDSFLPDHIQLKLGVNSIRGIYQSIDLNNRRLDLEFVAQAEGGGYRINSVNINEYINDIEDVKLTASGILALSPLSGDFNINISLHDLELFKLFYEPNTTMDIDGALNYNTHIIVGDNMSKFDLDGSLNVEKLKMKSTMISDQSDPLDLQIKYNLRIKPEEKIIQINELDVAANDGSNEVLTCSLSEALTLSFIQNDSEIHPPVKLIFGINRFRNALIADLLPKIENVNLYESLTSCKLDLTILNGGGTIEGVGKLDITDLLYNHQGKDLKLSGNIVYDVNLTDFFTASVIKDTIFKISIDDESVMQFKTHGTINIKNLSGEMGFSNMKLNFPLKKMLTESFHEKYDLDNLNSKGTLDLNFDEKFSNIHCRSDFSVADFKLENLLTSMDYNLSGRIDVDAGFNQNGSIELNSMLSSLKVNGGSLVDVTSKGKFEFSETNKSGYLDLKSNSTLDLQGIIDFAKGITDTNKPDQATNSVLNSDTPKTQGFDQDNPLPEFSFETKLDIPDIKYKSLTVKDFKAHVSASESLIRLHELALKFDKGELSFEGDCDISDLNNPEFNGDFDVKNLDIIPILNIVSDDTYGITSGTLAELQGKITGNGKTAKMIAESVTTEFRGKITGLDCSKKLVKHEKVMSLLGISAQDQIFDLIAVDAEGNLQKLGVNSFELRNTRFSVKANGNLEGVDMLPDMKMKIGYSGSNVEGAEKLRIKLTKNNDGYSYTNELPFKLASWEPKYLIGKWFPSIANDLLDLDEDDQETVQGIQTIGDVLSGEKSVKDAVGSIFGILKNREFKKLKERENKEQKDKENSEKSDVKDILNMFLK